MIEYLLRLFGFRREQGGPPYYDGWPIDCKIETIKRELGTSIRLGYHRWLWVDREEGGGYDLWLMSGEHSHNPLFGNGPSVTVQNGVFLYHAKMALTMWPVRDPGEQKAFEQMFTAAVDEALSKVRR